jgi:glycosyltransferase involved in cell wall biosynthesis
MKRLAIVHHVVSAGGVERLVQALLKALVDLPEASDWEFTLFSVGTNSAGAPVDTEQSPQGVTIRRLAEPKTSAIDTMRTAKRLFGIPGTGRALSHVGRALARGRSRWFEGELSPLRREIEGFFRQSPFDVAYFPYPYLIRPPRLDVPMVGTFHDFNYRHTKSLDAPMRARLQRQMPAWLRKCERVVVSTKTVGAELAELHPGFEAKTRLVRPSFPFVSQNPSPSQLDAFRQKHSLRQPFALITGWVVPHKNQTVVFEAIAGMKARGRNVSIICVGPNSHELKPDAPRRGPYVKHLLEVADRRGLTYGEDYQVLGYVSDFELDCLYRLASAVVIPATYEAGSFTGVEGMRAGCPVVFSRTPANLEQAGLVNDLAWLFEANDPSSLAHTLEDILDNPESARETARQAAIRVEENLSWRRAAAEYLSVFDEAMHSAIRD